VTSRNRFLSDLEHLLFDPHDSNEVGERDYLHRLLEHELWIFGEVYHLMNTERGLTDMLRTHPSSKTCPLRELSRSSAGTARGAEPTFTSRPGCMSSTSPDTRLSRSRHPTSRLARRT